MIRLKAVRTFLIKVLMLFVLCTVSLVIVLKWVSPPTTSIMMLNKLDAQFSDTAKPPIQYTWVDYSDISPYVSLAVVAAEDQKFPFHNGFDVEAIKKAIRHNKTGKRVRGASTISQQVAKNLFLWPGRSYLRKGLEAYFTFLIEVIWSKERILEIYVNIAQMGDNIFGVGAASQYSFKKPAYSLTPAEAALLAASLPSPARFSAAHPSTQVLKRRSWILSQMNLLGGMRYLRNI